MRSPSSASPTSRSRSLSRGNDDRLHRLRRVRVDERRRPESCASSPTNAPGTVRDDQLVSTEDAVLGDGDLASHDEEHAGADLAARDQALTLAESARLTEAPQPTDLHGVEIGNIWSYRVSKSDRLAEAMLPFTFLGHFEEVDARAPPRHRGATEITACDAPRTPGGLALVELSRPRRGAPIGDGPGNHSMGHVRGVVEARPSCCARVDQVCFAFALRPDRTDQDGRQPSRCRLAPRLRKETSSCRESRSCDWARWARPSPRACSPQACRRQFLLSRARTTLPTTEAKMASGGGAPAGPSGAD